MSAMLSANGGLQRFGVFVRTAISLLQQLGFCVSVFVVSAMQLVPVSTEQMTKLPDATQILLVATWERQNEH